MIQTYQTAQALLPVMVQHLIIVGQSPLECVVDVNNLEIIHLFLIMGR